MRWKGERGRRKERDGGEKEGLIGFYNQVSGSFLKTPQVSLHSQTLGAVLYFEIAPHTVAQAAPEHMPDQLPLYPKHWDDGRLPPCLTSHSQTSYPALSFKKALSAHLILYNFTPVLQYNVIINSLSPYKWRLKAVHLRSCWLQMAETACKPIISHQPPTLTVPPGVPKFSNFRILFCSWQHCGQIWAGQQLALSL